MTFGVEADEATVLLAAVGGWRDVMISGGPKSDYAFAQGRVA